jgi:hypothetical protein
VVRIYGTQTGLTNPYIEEQGPFSVRVFWTTFSFSWRINEQEIKDALRRPPMKKLQRCNFQPARWVGPVRQSFWRKERVNVHTYRFQAQYLPYRNAISYMAITFSVGELYWRQCVCAKQYSQKN